MQHHTHIEGPSRCCSNACGTSEARTPLVAGRQYRQTTTLLTPANMTLKSRDILLRYALSRHLGLLVTASLPPSSTPLPQDVLRSPVSTHLPLPPLFPSCLCAQTAHTSSLRVSIDAFTLLPPPYPSLPPPATQPPLQPRQCLPPLPHPLISSPGLQPLSH